MQEEESWKKSILDKQVRPGGILEAVESALCWNAVVMMMEMMIVAKMKFDIIIIEECFDPRV